LCLCHTIITINSKMHEVKVNSITSCLQNGDYLADKFINLAVCKELSQIRLSTDCPNELFVVVVGSVIHGFNFDTIPSIGIGPFGRPDEILSDAINGLNIIDTFTVPGLVVWLIWIWLVIQG